MDKGLQIQVELHRKGEKIFSKIKREIEKQPKQTKIEYLLSNETVISISDNKIWIYGLIRDGEESEICTVAAFENVYGSKKVVKEALYFYLVNSGYSYSSEEDIISEKEVRKIIRIFSTI